LTIIGYDVGLIGFVFSSEKILIYYF